MCSCRPDPVRSGHEPADRIIRHQVRDLFGRVGPFGSKPRRRTVQRAEKRACGDGRIGRAQFAPPHAGRDERPDAPLVAIALGDDERAEAGGKRVDLEVRRRSLDTVDEARDVRGGEAAQPRGERAWIRAGLRERGEQPLERAVLTEEEELVLAAKVVIQVGGGQICGHGDVAHAGGREAAVAEDAGGRAQNRQAARVGAALHAHGAARRLIRTAVR